MRERGVMAAVLVTAVYLGVSAAQAPRPLPPVVTDSGSIAGRTLSSGVKAWLGIPFAKAPVGALRWQAPQPNRWDGVYNADRKMAQCIQILRPRDINHFFGEEPTSEDCLFMNI